MASEQEHETSREWLRLHAAQLALRGDVEDSTDAEERSALVEQFGRNRDAIAAIERSQSQQPVTAPAEGPRKVSATVSDQHSGNEHIDDNAVNVDDLFDSLGLNDDREEPVDAVPPIGPEEGSHSRLWAALGGALGVALVVATGAAVWIAGSDESTETAAQGGADVNTTTAESDLDAQADDVRASLERLGFDRVEVDVRNSVIHVSGVVPSEQELSSLRSTVLGAVDADLLDMSGLEVAAAGYNGETAAPPGAPPAGFVPPTPEQQENLQKELNRVLTETPIVFDPGSTSLNELQLTVLDTAVIGLLEAHPGVPVRLVGYTDDTGGEYKNSLLSFARANAVRDYLISRGVPEFVLRPEGRGGDDASGEAGADRRVEIEVIIGPPGP